MSKIIPVDFRGDQLFGFEADDGMFVALKPIVEAMGLDWSAQFRRVKRNCLLKKTMRMFLHPTKGGPQLACCIRLDMVSRWLFTIDSNRVIDEEVRARVLTYQRECVATLSVEFHKLLSNTAELPSADMFVKTIEHGKG